MDAGQRKEALVAAGFPVERVVGDAGPIGVIWSYFPEEAVASEQAQALIASFDAPK